MTRSATESAKARRQYRRSDRRTEKQRAAGARWVAAMRGEYAPEKPCGWEKLLRELRLTEEAAMVEIRGVSGAGSPRRLSGVGGVSAVTDAGHRLREYARRYCGVRYVPSTVLRALGLGGDGGAACAGRTRRAEPDGRRRGREAG